VQRELRHHQQRSPTFDDRAIHAAVFVGEYPKVAELAGDVVDIPTSAGPSSLATPAKTSKPAPMRPVVRPSTLTAARLTR
jgi:hypothetical protein